MDIAEVQRIDMTLRKCVQSLCAPIWWESARQASRSQRHDVCRPDT